ncbi:MAG TPA: RagB/SusD family nutrient uptake outer membrane protein [Chitinophagaceae bacterium]|nr:RagB/SusD family nutrient uptake outer membrane protein [Chitinophagaceae bacterium]
MRITKFNKIIGAALIGLAVFACKKSFLERLPEASLNEATLANEKGVNAVLIGAYAALDGWADNGWSNAAGNPWPTAGSNWVWGSVTSDDATPGSQFNDQIPIERMNRYQYQTDDTYFRGKFQAIYWGIGRANSTIRLADKATDMSAAAKDQVLAEARFLRAWYHYDGYKMWKFIPYIDETVTEFRQKNDVDIFDKIKADLEFAISKLPEKANNSSGRANKGAAQALLARAYMFVGKYAEAKPLLAAIISGNKYSLVANYHDNYDASKQNNNEMMWVYKSSVNDGAGESANGNWGDRLLGIHNMPGANACCGFHTATFNLLNAMKTDPVTGLPMANFNASDFNQATDNLDPRADWTFGRPGIPFYDWGPFQAAWMRDVGYTGYLGPRKSTFHKGQYKNLSTASGWSDWPNAIDVPLIRYADVLLMAAECEIETAGNLVQANTWINMVRARAQNYVQGAGTSEATISQALPVPVAGITTDIVNSTNYKLGLWPAFANQAAARDALRWERRLEFAMEGYRYFDLLRWGIAEQVLNAYVNVEKNKLACYAGAETFSSKHKLYPIPAVEIELSKINGEAQLKQNPGY